MNHVRLVHLEQKRLTIWGTMLDGYGKDNHRLQGVVHYQKEIIYCWPSSNGLQNRGH